MASFHFNELKNKISFHNLTDVGSIPVGSNGSIIKETKNIQERMRRKHLKERQEELRAVLCKEENLTKNATKNELVQKATIYAKRLKTENKELEIRKLELATKQQELEDRLYLLNSGQKDEETIIVREWEDTPMYSCDFDEFCPLTTDDAEEMFQHEQEIHLVGDVTFTCDYQGCKESFHSIYGLVGHKKVHGKEESNASLTLLKKPEILLKCDQKLCNKSFSSRDLYLSHANDHKRRKKDLELLNMKRYGMEQSQIRRPPEAPNKYILNKQAQISNERGRSHLKESPEVSVDDNKRVVYRCERPLGKDGKSCNKIFMNLEAMRIHDFLHEELMLFKCPIDNCEYIYGLPSKVKSHVQLYHLNNLNSLETFRGEDLKPLNFEERKRLNCKMQNAFTIADQGVFVLMNNFLEAVIDAKIMMDEVKEEIEQNMLKEFSKSLKVDQNGMNYFKHQNIQFVQKDNVISRLDSNVVDRQNDEDNCLSQIKREQEIEEVVVKVEPDEELFGMLEDQEINLTENGKEPFHEIDGEMTSELLHQSEDELDTDEDPMFSI